MPAELNCRTVAVVGRKVSSSSASVGYGQRRPVVTSGGHRQSTPVTLTLDTMATIKMDGEARKVPRTGI